MKKMKIIVKIAIILKKMGKKIKLKKEKVKAKKKKTKKMI